MALCARLLSNPTRQRAIRAPRRSPRRTVCACVGSALGQQQKLVTALVTLGIISARSNKTSDEKILVVRGLLLQMQTAPFRKLPGLLDAAVYELM